MKRFTALVLAFCMVFALAGGILAEEDVPGQYGYIDRDGHLVIGLKFDYAYPLVNGLARVFTGTLDSYGDPADYVGTTATDSEYTFAFEGTLNEIGTPDEGIFYLMKTDGTYLSRGYTTDFCVVPDGEGIWRVAENGTWYIVNMEGEETAAYECDNLYPCGEDRVMLKKDGLYALADCRGNMITDYLFDSIEAASGDRIPVRFAGTDPE